MLPLDKVTILKMEATMLTLEKTSKDNAGWETVPETKDPLREKFCQVRQFSEFLGEPLAPEDCVIQTMPEVSPAKWHLAHTTWFFETFILRPFLPDYRSLHPQYAYLFNSYYNAAGKMHPRPQRGLISRPTLAETFAYRSYVDNLMCELIDQANDTQMEALARLVVLGVNHEQQHQELMLTDIKHVFSMNPLHPIYRERAKAAPCVSEPDAPRPLWNKYKGGIFNIGHEGDSFHFDNECPRHEVLLRPFALANTLVTNGDYMAFIDDKGYERPEFWLSLGWMAVNERNWRAPLYWEKQGNTWWSHTLSGFRPVEENEPVCHLSYFEADAYARWVGARLPTEVEWETASAAVPVEGHYVEAGYYHPAPAPAAGYALQQMFGDLWQWTQSAYAAYPGFMPVTGALGEYNGKFMCNQYVLRGASCATAKSHARRTYRNFFPPDARWQFSGLRLAKDLA
jgi:ergothioneine biosynthesis protein EgtB